MGVHYLKIYPIFFQAISDGRKLFEVRPKGIPWHIGDILVLREYDSLNGYTGRELQRQITYILDDVRWCKRGFVVLGISII